MIFIDDFKNIPKWRKLGIKGRETVLLSELLSNT